MHACISFGLIVAAMADFDDTRKASAMYFLAFGRLAIKTAMHCWNVHSL